MSYFSKITGLLISGLGKIIRATETGELAVEIGGSNTSAFGDILTVEHSPLFQYSFIYASTFNSQIMLNTVASAGTVDTSSGRLRLQSGTNAAGSAIHQSVKIALYRAGQGHTVRFTTAFVTNAAGSTQIVGIANVGSGTTALDGFFFGYNGTAFGILHRINSVDTWYVKTAWNIDVCDGSNSVSNPSGFNWNPANGTVMQIRYPFLGYGDIKFYVQNPVNGQWVNVHVIRYNNTVQTLELTNPGMNFYAQALNAGNTTNLTMYVGSVGVFLSGARVFTGPQYAADALNSTNSSGVEFPIISLANCTSINGVPNRGMIRLRSMAVTTDGSNAYMRVRIRKGQALTSPTWQAINGTVSVAPTTLTAAQSMAFMDTAATYGSPPTANPGSPGSSNIIFATSIPRQAGYHIDLTPFDIFLVPGDIISMTGIGGLNNINTLATLNWNEDT